MRQFLEQHEQVFVVEQNRDAQLRALLINECGIDPAKLVSVLHYDGNPMTARFVEREIAEKASLFGLAFREQDTGNREQKVMGK